MCEAVPVLVSGSAHELAETVAKHVRNAGMLRCIGQKKSCQAGLEI